MIIFFLNVGRSGSRAVADAYGLLHEPDGRKPNIIALSERIKNSKGFYGETSHFWKSHLDKLKKSIPNAFFVHLVRNGRDVVSSFFDSSHHYLYIPNEPPHRNETLPIDGFEQMIRFEKLCWYWRYWNEVIEKYAHCRVRLEDLNIPVKNKGFPHTEWNIEMERIFKRICGKLNKKYGYEN